MRYLGIDYGEKRIGLSVSDEAGSFAFPRETIVADSSAVSVIAELVANEGIGAIVIGIPETHSGNENKIEATIRRFAGSLQEATGFTPSFQNEQYSSVEASRFAPGEKKDDAVSAALILQRFLDAHGGKQ